MQMHNESGRENTSDVVGSLAPVTKAAPTSTRYADARPAGAEQHDGRRMSPEREAQIRQRVMDGTYDSLGYVDEVARRIIRSADL